jgi:hypothetical protein
MRLPVRAFHTVLSRQEPSLHSAETRRHSPASPLLSAVRPQVSSSSGPTAMGRYNLPVSKARNRCALHQKARAKGRLGVTHTGQRTGRAHAGTRVASLHPSTVGSHQSCAWCQAVPEKECVALKASVKTEVVSVVVSAPANSQHPHPIRTFGRREWPPKLGWPLVRYAYCYS